MAVFVPEFTPSVEAYRARSTHHDLLPRCDGLRQSAAVLAVVLFARSSRALEGFNLGPVVQVGFALTGFLLAGFLLRRKGEGGEPGTTEPASKVVDLLRSLPVAQVVVAVVAILYLPGLLALEKLPISDVTELPALVNSWLKTSFADFLSCSTNGQTLIAWPLIVLLAPRRLLGVIFLGALGAGLAVQISGLIADEVHAATILVNPSPLDFLAIGALVAAIVQGVGRSGNGPLARWALMMGLVLAAASLGWQAQGGLTHWGSIPLLAAPTGFGAVNFILKIIGTTLVASLAWRDVSR